MVRMLLSFQRPSYLFGKVVPSQGYVRDRHAIPERTDQYSAGGSSRGPSRLAAHRFRKAAINPGPH